MEKSQQYGLKTYYRDVQQIEKQLTSKMKQRKYERYRNDDKKVKQKQKRSRFSLDTLKYSHPSSQKATQNQIKATEKYFQLIDESMIDKNALDNSTITKQQNKKIILEIHGLDDADEDKSTIKNHCRKQRVKGIDERREQSKGKGRILAEQLVGMLQKRDRVYEIVKKHCGLSSGDYASQFEDKLQKYSIYKNFLLKLKKLMSNI